MEFLSIFVIFYIFCFLKKVKYTETLSKKIVFFVRKIINSEHHNLFLGVYDHCIKKSEFLLLLQQKWILICLIKTTSPTGIAPFLLAQVLMDIFFVPQVLKYSISLLLLRFPLSNDLLYNIVLFKIAKRHVWNSSSP